jgi:hypothetical protein
MDTAERRHRHASAERQRAPARWPHTGGARVTRGGEYRGQEDQISASPACPAQLSRAVGRARHQPAPRAQLAGPMSAAQMHSGAKRRRQPSVAGHHEGEPSHPADACQVAPQCQASRLAVVAQHDAAQTARQPRHRCARIGQSPRIGKQPERRQAFPRAVSAGSLMCPGHESRVHGWLQDPAPGLTLAQAAPGQDERRWCKILPLPLRAWAAKRTKGGGGVRAIRARRHTHPSPYPLPQGEGENFVRTRRYSDAHAVTSGHDEECDSW